MWVRVMVTKAKNGGQTLAGALEMEQGLRAK